MNIIKTRIPDVKIIEPVVFEDERGFFMETWNQQVFEELGINENFVQDNHSRSCKNTLRGLHYQIENAQGKLVRVTSGKVFDVAVDLRKSSTTFGQWTGVMLSEENKKMFWVPPGFAHGFLVMSEVADFQYKCTDVYSPGYERSIHWRDQDLNIEWPLPINESAVVSKKDQLAKPFCLSEYYK